MTRTSKSSPNESDKVLRSRSAVSFKPSSRKLSKQSAEADSKNRRSQASKSQTKGTLFSPFCALSAYAPVVLIMSVYHRCNEKCHETKQNEKRDHLIK